MIEIIRPGAQASVQDLGRVGFRRFGVGRSGAADTLALRVGNRLLGNDPNAAAIEFTLGRASLRFNADMRVALTGAEYPTIYASAQALATAIDTRSMMFFWRPADRDWLSACVRGGLGCSLGC